MKTYQVNHDDFLWMLYEVGNIHFDDDLGPFYAYWVTRRMTNNQ